jgi:peptidoglycan/LPS O-acetylase OafA/YrhL
MHISLTKQPEIFQKNTALEIIRAFAALMVFAGHLNTKVDGWQKIGFLNYFLNMGTEAVILFFILSGVVIQMSQERKSRDFKDFILDRLIRIYPLYIVAIIIALVVAVIKGISIPPEQIVGHLFFLQTLQGYIVGILPTNESLWSLSFEIFFYLMFALSLVYRRFMRLWLVLALLSVLIKGKPLLVICLTIGVTFVFSHILELIIQPKLSKELKKFAFGKAF